MSYSIKHEIPVQDICKLERNQDSEYEVEGGGGGSILTNTNLSCWPWSSILFPKYLIYYLYFSKIFGIVFIIQMYLIHNLTYASLILLSIMFSITLAMYKTFDNNF